MKIIFEYGCHLVDVECNDGESIDDLILSIVKQYDIDLSYAKRTEMMWFINGLAIMREDWGKPSLHDQDLVQVKNYSGFLRISPVDGKPWKYWKED
jgi:hypothetical protein